MGTTAHIIVTARPAQRSNAETLAERGRRRVRELEARWSRFLPSSEISRLNASGGGELRVSADTRLLVRRAVEGWSVTEGRFDPTVLASLISIGYSKTFEAVQRDAPDTVGTPIPAQGCSAIVVDDHRSTIRLPHGVAFDPGGIGKGLAADLVVEELLAARANGACVEIGGDVRVAGEGPEGRGWVVRIDDPRPDNSAIAEVWLREGAVASSSLLRRQWMAAGSSFHHLLDPSTGLPVPADVAGAAVLASSGWLAEVLATAACVDGVGTAIAAVGASGVVVPRHGRPRLVGEFARFAG
jgi:thiamine biosynthesis lipoprotein